MKWSKFEKEYLHEKSGWFEKSRKQTRRALKTVVPKLPDSAIPENLLIFAPNSNLMGMVWKGNYSDQYMYLDWQLETDTFEEAVFTVAHEFAHLELQHPSRPTSGSKKHMKQHEYEADTLAEHWGFKKPVKPKKKKKKK